MNMVPGEPKNTGEWADFCDKTELVLNSGVKSPNVLETAYRVKLAVQCHLNTDQDT